MYQLIFWHSVYCRIVVDQQKKARWLPNKLHFNGKNKRLASNMHSYKACINQKSARVLGMKSMCCICYFVNRPPTLAFPCSLSFVVLAVQWLIFVWNHWHLQSNLWIVLFCCPNRALKIGKWLIYSNNNEDQKLWLTCNSLFTWHLHHWQ